MSGDRDALAALITETIGDNHDGSAVSAPDRIVLIVQSDGDGAVTISTSALADAILAAGWVKADAELSDSDRDWEQP